MIELKFKGRTHFPVYNNNIVEGGVHERYWPNRKVDVMTLQNWLCEQGVRFDHREDPLKIALALFMERFLFDANYKKIVFPWLFTLAQDLEQFNSFPWEKFVFQMMLHYLNNASCSPKLGKDKIR